MENLRFFCFRFMWRGQNETEVFCMQFVLFDKLKDLAGLELWMLLAALAIAIVLAAAILRYR